METDRHYFIEGLFVIVLSVAAAFFFVWLSTSGHRDDVRGPQAVPLDPRKPGGRRAAAVGGNEGREERRDFLAVNIDAVAGRPRASSGG